MPGVEEVELGAFFHCEAIEHVECQKLEIIGGYAFSECKSLSSIDLLSVKSVEEGAFNNCVVLRDVKFGNSLESIGEKALMLSTAKILGHVTLVQIPWLPSMQKK